MSLKAMAAVWEDSLARGNNRLVLLAIADIVGDDGTGCWLHQANIAAKAGISLRTLQRCIAELIADDELRVDRENTRTTNDYTVVVAWKRSVADEVRKQNTRQVDVSLVDESGKTTKSGANDGFSSGEKDTHGNLTCVTEHVSAPAEPCGSDATAVNLTRQVDGGKKATADRSGVSDAPSGGGPDPSLIRSLPARARHDKLTGVPKSNGSLIPRNPTAQWERGMERQHANCHPEVCSWRDKKVRECMPLALVSRYAQKLPGLSDDAAIADVIAWARVDAPPADYVAPGDVYEHWRLRWDLTRANAPGARAKGVTTERSTVPGAAATDALIREITGGRTA